MKNTLLILGSILGLLLLIIISFFAKEGSIAWNKYFKPKEENVKREVFLQTRSYNEARVQELSKYRLEYLKAKQSGDEASAAAIKSTIQHTFAEYDSSKLQPTLRQFLEREIFNY